MDGLPNLDVALTADSSLPSISANGMKLRAARRAPGATLGLRLCPRARVLYL
jgi:hypothetical protein